MGHMRRRGELGSDLCIRVYDCSEDGGAGVAQWDI